jgi:hypothetical protein
MIFVILKVWFGKMILRKGLWYLVFAEYGVLLEVSCWLTWGYCAYG